MAGLWYSFVVGFQGPIDGISVLSMHVLSLASTKYGIMISYSLSSRFIRILSSRFNDILVLRFNGSQGCRFNGINGLATL